MTKDELYKAAKIGANGDVKNKGKGKAAMVEDDGAEVDDDQEAGPELPPDFDPEADIPEDGEDEEGGRFFGGGMSRQTAQAMAYIDQAEADGGDVAVRVHHPSVVFFSLGGCGWFFSEADGVLSQPEKFDTAWLRKLALNFEKRISKNAEMRAKYENDPQKCVNIPS